MKNIFYVIISIIFLFSNPCFADEMTASEMEDYVKIYSELAPAKFSFIHGIDPDQYYDMQAYIPPQVILALICFHTVPH